LKRGSTFQREIGPTDENCPAAISKKNSGRPAKTSIMTYGIRKLAEISYKANNNNYVDVKNSRCPRYTLTRFDLLVTNMARKFVMGNVT